MKKQSSIPAKHLKKIKHLEKDTQLICTLSHSELVGKAESGAKTTSGNGKLQLDIGNFSLIRTRALSWSGLSFLSQKFQLKWKSTEKYRNWIPMEKSNRRSRYSDSTVKNKMKKTKGTLCFWRIWGPWLSESEHQVLYFFSPLAASVLIDQNALRF